ncbi:MAG: hypothetical protein RMZ41_002325 [Nostoc sp. DedVER02]|uniref:hypothetical protein n=1 Tax=unclassified Nostoc TaxID=2593658 RepID=UPI002AD448D0|nr:MULTISPECIES: hypothetical protein [unclassified Nostoc]MDZ7987005.1 hypothetical protein [Nostoc sp. DedVER02]MDZ8116523.1 hypothetical protein [Nostoc sp. DedVER01b]
MFYEKNVIRITYANKSLHLFSGNRFLGKKSWENGCPVNGQAFFPVREKYERQLGANRTFEKKGGGVGEDEKDKGDEGDEGK